MYLPLFSPKINSTLIYRETTSGPSKQLDYICVSGRLHEKEPTKWDKPECVEVMSAPELRHRHSVSSNKSRMRPGDFQSLINMSLTHSFSACGDLTLKLRQERSLVPKSISSRNSRP